MPLTRIHAISLAQDEADCFDTHIANLEAIAGPEGGMGELTPSIAELKDAVGRLRHRLVQAQLARMQ